MSQWNMMLVCILLATAVPPTSAEQVSPVQKVLQMMSDMKSKAIKDKNDEIATFTTFAQFCKDNMAEKDRAVSDATDSISKLTADIEQYSSQAKVLGKEIQRLDASADAATNDKDASTAQFETEQADYKTTHAEYETNIADIEVGTSQLKSMMSATNAASLIQKMVSTSRLPDSARQVLSSFLEKASTHKLEASAPEAAAFESQSDGIVGMMQQLTDNLETQKTTLEQEFVKARGAYQMTQQTLTDQIDRDTTLRQHKSASMKDKENAAASADGDRSSTQISMASDEAFLKDLHGECATKSSEYEANQKVRAGEVQALNKAIEIISGGAVAGAAETHLPQLLQKKSKGHRAASLAQLRNDGTKKHKASQTAVAAFLQAQGKMLGSRVLTSLSSRVAEDPFQKVKKMIQDMVYKLMEEANGEADHKGFCDTELSTNKVTRDQKTTLADELTASIEGMTAKMATLGSQIAELSEQLAEIDAAVATATSIRADEKAKSIKTITEAVTASAAVERALGVLQNYYDGLALLQKGKSAAHGRAQSGSPTGVIGMLEVIRADFERLESDTKAGEEENQRQYQKFMEDSASNKAVKGSQVKNKSETRMETDVATATAKKELKITQEELTAAKAYYEKLRPSCVDSGNAYEDRVQRRKEEIDSLAEALKILDQQAI